MTLERVADKRHMNFSNVADKLRRNNRQRYTDIMNTHKERRLKHLDLDAIWRDLESGMSLNKLAEKNGVYSSTLSRILTRNDKYRYTEIMEKRRPKFDVQKAWIDLEGGNPITEIAESMDVDRESLSERLRRLDASRYKKAIRRNQTRPKKQVPVKTLLKCLERGKSLSELSRESGIGWATLANRLREDSASRYRELVERNLRRPRVQIPDASEVLKRLQTGVSLTRLAGEFNVSPMTLRYRLLHADSDKYETIMRERKRGLPPVSQLWKRLEQGESITGVAREYRVDPNRLSKKLRQVNKGRLRKLLENARKARPKRRVKLGLLDVLGIWDELEKGKSLTEIARNYSTKRQTIARTLLEINKNRYQRLMKLERVKRGISLRGHVPLRRRVKGGAESQLENQVKKALEEHGIAFELHIHMKLGKHRYFPDFLVGVDTIIEAAGVNFTDYWERFRKKVRDYFRFGYSVVVVVPDTLYGKATRYLARSIVEVIRVKDLEHYLEAFGPKQSFPV